MQPSSSLTWTTSHQPFVIVIIESLDVPVFLSGCVLSDEIGRCVDIDALLRLNCSCASSVSVETTNRWNLNYLAFDQKTGYVSQSLMRKIGQEKHVRKRLRRHTPKDMSVMRQ